MIAGIVIVVLVLVIVSVALAGGLRRMVRDEREVERRIESPGTHTVSYAVPNGVDPADLRVAVARAGFASVVATTDLRRCLHVECADGDRARLREVIESAHESAYDGTELDLRPVVFEDERPSHN